MTNDREIDLAALRLRARLEDLLEHLPEDDPAYMSVSVLEDIRRSRRRWKISKVGAGRSEMPRKGIAGKSAGSDDTDDYWTLGLFGL